MKLIQKITGELLGDAWEQALDCLNEPVYLVDLQDRVIRGNRAFYERINHQPEEVVGTVVSQYFHPEGEESPCPACQARYNREDAVLTLDADDPRNHSGRDMQISVRVVRDSHGEPVAILQHIHDQSLLKQEQRRLQKNEEKFRVLLDASPDPLVITNCEGNIVFANQLCSSVFGYRVDDLIGKKIEIFVPDDMQSYHAELRQRFQSQPSSRPMGSGLELYAMTASGEKLDVEISLSPITIDDELLVIASIRDISERKRIESERERLSHFPEHNPMPIFEVGRNGDVHYMNDAAGKLLEEYLNNDVSILIAGLDKVYEQLQQSGGSLIRDIVCVDRIYEQKIVYLQKTDVILVYNWEITQIRNLVKKLSYHATHDALTGLVNRAEFERRVENALSDACADNCSHVLCYLDLDQFKIINDSCGHSAGDALLKQLAEMLRTRIRGGDTLARLGGDEFGLLLLGCDVQTALKITESIRKSIEDFHFVWNKKIFTIGVSSGLVEINQHYQSGNQLLQAADTACYIAKDQGRNRIHIYEHEHLGQQAHIRNIEWAQKIQAALSNDEFVLYRQRIQSLASEDDFHYEILLRLQGEDGLIKPSAFLPAAERYHLERKIDEWVINRTFQLIKQGKMGDRLCTINLSNSSLTDNSMIEYVIDKLDEYSINPEQICFEITESAMISGLFQVQRMVSTLKGLGCQFYLDDFGSGVSSFCYLKNTAVDAVKIDGILAKDAAVEPANEAMVKAINDVAHAMGCKTIAEYVADRKTYEKMQEIGVDYVQGYEIHITEPIE